MDTKAAVAGMLKQQ